MGSSDVEAHFWQALKTDTIQPYTRVSLVASKATGMLLVNILRSYNNMVHETSS